MTVHSHTIDASAETWGNPRPRKFPYNLSYHTRHMAEKRGLSLCRLVGDDLALWRAATGSPFEVIPPGWVIKDSNGSPVRYEPRLQEAHDYLASLPEKQADQVLPAPSAADLLAIATQVRS